MAGQRHTVQVSETSTVDIENGHVTTNNTMNLSNGRFPKEIRIVDSIISVSSAKTMKVSQN